MTQSATTDGRKRPATESLTDAEYNRLLASERRRTLLDVLDDQPTTVDLETLATAIARRECAGDALDSIKIDLHHTHLPMMAEMEVVEYDPTSCLVDP